MVFFIRAKSYYRYALDLYKDLPAFKNKPEEFKNRAKEIFQIGLKSLWALSQISPPEKPPSFDEIWTKALEAVDEEERIKFKTLKEIIFSENFSTDQLLSKLEEFFRILQKTLRPIL